MTQPVPAPAATTRMVTREGGVVDVPIDEAAGHYLSGALGFVPGSQTVVDVGGEKKMVSAEDAATMLDRSQGVGVDFSTPAELRTQEKEREFSGVGPTLAAVGTGAASGLTLGLSDAVAAGVGGESTRRYLEEQREFRPGARLVGEIGGALLPALVSGGSSAAVSAGRVGLEGATLAREASVLSRAADVGAQGLRLATAPGRAVSALGEAAGGFAARAGTGLGLSEGGLAARALDATARGIAEGATYGLGAAVSDASIRGDDLTAELLIAGAGHGALLGAGAGLGLTAGGAALAGIGRAGKAAAERTVTLAEKLGAEIPTLETFAERKAIQSSGANLRQTAELDALDKASPGVRARVAKQMLDEVPAELGAKSLANVSRAEMPEAVEKLWASKGKAIGEKLDALDAHVREIERFAQAGEEAGLRPNVSGVVESARANILAPLESIPGRENDAAKLAHYLDSLETKGAEAGFRRAHEIRSSLDKQIKWNAMPDAGYADALKGVRSALESELVRAGDVVASKVGAEFSAGYAVAKQEYQAASWLLKAVEKGAASEASRRSLGWSEQVGILGGSNALGGVLGSVLGPAGAVVGNVVGGIAGAALQNAARRYGDQAAATIASRAVKSDLLKSITGTVEETMGARVKALVGFGEKAGREAKALTYRSAEHADDLPSRFEKKRTEVAAMIPAAMARAKQAAERIAVASPDLAQTTERKAISIATNIANQLPKVPPSDPLTPQFDKPRVPVAQMVSFLRYTRAVEEPLSVLEDARQGTLTREAVTAVRENYPALYQAMRQDVMGQLINAKDRPDYDTRRQLGMLLSMPADRSLEPDFIKTVQAALATQPKQTPHQGANSEVADASAYANRSDRLAGDKP